MSQSHPSTSRLPDPAAEHSLPQGPEARQATASSSSQPAFPAARNRSGILSRGHSNRSATHISSPEPSLLYPSASEDDGESDFISDSGPLPKRFPPSYPSSAKSSSSLQSQYRNALTSSGGPQIPRISPLASAASSSSNLVEATYAANDVHRADYATALGGRSAAAANDDRGFDLSRAKSISSVSSVTSTSSMEAAPFRAAPLGKIRMSYTGGAAAAGSGRGPASAIRVHPRDPLGSTSIADLHEDIAFKSPRTPNAGGMTALMEAAQEAAIAASQQRTAEEDTTFPELSMSGSAELPRRTVEGVAPVEKVVSSPAAALAARQRGFLPKPPTNEWLYRNGPGLNANMGGKPIPGAYRSLAEMTQGTAENIPTTSPSPCPSPTSKRTAAVIRNKLAKSASKLGLKPLTVVPGATPLHPRVASEFADSASTTSEVLDVQQDLISSATGGALSDPRSINVRPRSVALASSLLSSSSGSSGEFMVRTSSATNAPLIVPRLSPHPDATQRMSKAGGFFPGPTPGQDIAAMAKSSASPSGSPLSQAVEDEDQTLPILSLSALRPRPGNRDSFSKAASKRRSSATPSASGGIDADVVTPKGDTDSPPRCANVDGGGYSHQQGTPSQPTPAEVVRMEAQAGIARLPTVGSGPMPGPTPTVRPHASCKTSAAAHTSEDPASTVASLPPSTVLVPPAATTTSTGGAVEPSAKEVPRSRPVIVRSTSSQSKASLASSTSYESLAGRASDGGGQQRPTAMDTYPATGYSSLQNFRWDDSHRGTPSNGTDLEAQEDDRSNAEDGHLHPSPQDSISPSLHTPAAEDHGWADPDRPLPQRSASAMSYASEDHLELGAEAPGVTSGQEEPAPVSRESSRAPSPTGFAGHTAGGPVSKGANGKSHLSKPDLKAKALPPSVVPPPMLRMESTNTSVSKAVSDTSDMAPPMPFKRPARLAAGRMNSSENRYDVMEGGVKGASSDGNLTDSSTASGALAAPAMSSATGDRLSVIAESSPDRRSSNSSVGSTASAAPSPQGLKEADIPATLPEPTQSSVALPSMSRPRGRDDFEFGDILGEGSYSTVILAWDLLTHASTSASSRPEAVTSVASALAGNGSKADATLREGKRAYAIKVLDKIHILKERKQKYVAVEKEALSLLVRHPGVIRLYWTFQDQESLYFVLELAPNGELLTFIKKYGSFDENTTRYYAAQLLDAISGMHAVGVIHRDVKPENVLLDDKMKVKVTDFGSAKVVNKAGGDTATGNAAGPPRANSFVGTAEYVSPELLTDKAASKASDFWAFGCVVFQMLAGRPPFKAISEYQTFQKIIKREFEMPSELSEEATDLLNNLLVLEPEQRLREEQIRSHPFFRGVDWTTLWQTEAPPMKTGIRAAPPPKEPREQEMSSNFDGVFGDQDWAREDDLGSEEEEEEPSCASQEHVPALEVSPGDSSDEETGDDDGRSLAPSADLVSLQSGHRADVEEDESPFSSRSHFGAPDSAAGTAPTTISSSRSLAARDRPLSQPASTPAARPSVAVLNWAALLLPHEAVLYASPTVHRRTGTANLQSKKRMLILTDFPRLLCVKEDAQSLKVKSEVLLTLPGEGSSNHKSSTTAGGGGGNLLASPSPASSVPSTRRGSVSGTPSTLVVINTLASSAALGAINPNVLLSIEQRGMKTLIIHTPARSYTYDDPSGDASNWMRSIRAAAARR